MSQEDLIPFNKIPKEKHMILSKLGGSSKSIRKSEGAKWRHAKNRFSNRGMSSSEALWLIERVENSKAMAADILNFLDEVKKDISPNQRIALANTLKDLLKIIHGNSLKSEPVVINSPQNINDIIREAYRERMEKENLNHKSEKDQLISFNNSSK